MTDSHRQAGVGASKLWPRWRWSATAARLSPCFAAGAVLFFLLGICGRGWDINGQPTFLENDTSDAALESRLATRSALLASVCAKLSNPGRAEAAAAAAAVDPTRFYFMKDPGFMFCMIPKVASTSFSRFILSASQKVRGGLENLGLRPGPVENSVTEGTFKAMVVRHPLDRLLSAYQYIFRDEVKKDTNGTNMYSNLTRLLVANYRSGQAQESGQGMLTFPEFVRFIVNGTVENLKGDWAMSGGSWVRDANLNGHWLPYWRLCSPCHPSARPTAVLKLDGGAIREEADLVFRRAGVFDFFASRGGLGNLSLPWANPSSEGRSSLLRDRYFGQLSPSHVRALFHKYRVDHEMFGYTIQPFLSIAEGRKP